MLQLLFDHGHHLDDYCCVAAAQMGHLACLKWLVSNGCRLDGDAGQATWAAASDPSGGQLLHVSVDDWEEAMEMGRLTKWIPQLHVLKWLIEQDCVRDPDDESALLSKFLAAEWVQKPQ